MRLSAAPCVENCQTDVFLLNPMFLRFKFWLKSGNSGHYMRFYAPLPRNCLNICCSEKNFRTEAVENMNLLLCPLCIFRMSFRDKQESV
jgi:hypothetical protein